VAGKRLSGRSDCQPFLRKLLPPVIWTGQDAIVFNGRDAALCDSPGAANPDLLEAIDRHLGAWLSGAPLGYYTTLSRWTEKAPAYRVPQSVYWAIGITGGLFVVAVGMVLALRRQVQARRGIWSKSTRRCARARCATS